MSRIASTLGFLFLTGLIATLGQAHETYNLSGYGADLGGSTNGVDGSPTAVPPAEWTGGGVLAYTGGLPAMWFAGIHQVGKVRTIQTGTGAAPPYGSLISEVQEYNDANDPDYPEDRVLAVAGLSWSDPGNSDQGWGHGLDYGLVHFSPVETLLAGGPLKFTITVSDDPSDDATPQLAYALYQGWDTNAASVRHQTFTTSPSPVDDPLGSTGLTLVDYQVAQAPGQSLSGTYALDETTGGNFMLLIGGLGGVAGQYQTTVTLQPDLGLAVCEGEVDTCTSDLDSANMDLATATADADADGTPDLADACIDTASGDEVDVAGCSLGQFCASFDVTTKDGKKGCKKADWQNDEPVMKKKEKDCIADKKAGLCLPAS